MSIRVRVVVIISSIVVLIAASSMGASIYLSRIQLIKTIESDMTAVNGLAVKLFATSLRLMRTELDEVAHNILPVFTGSMPLEGEALSTLLGFYTQSHNYLALTVMSSQKIIASFGADAPDDSFTQSEYVRRALMSERNFSSTYINSRGTLVMRLSSPLGNGMVLMATLPGQVLSDIISEYRVWRTGNVLIVDREGVIIANIRPFLVNERHKLSEIVDWNYRPRQTQSFFDSLLSGKTGSGIYSYRGFPRVGAYSPMPGTDGWICIIAAPINESPANDMQGILLLSGGIFLVLGIIAALVAGGFIAEPFQKIREQNHRLKELREAAENASRAKSDFLSTMSHEMRTPMNAIIGMTNIGKNAPDLEKKDYAFGKIEDASTHLLGVINDILDMSKIEANKFELNPALFSFERMLQKTVNVINFRVHEKRQNLSVRLDERIPPMLKGDDQRLAQVITNLLSNAVKFTPEEGSIRLNAEFIEEKDGVCTLQVSVADSGIGISAEQQAKLFSSFTQAESNTSRKFGGTGLGLAISKRIIEMMGGCIRIESELGKGAAFICTLRLERVAEEAPHDPALEQAEPAPEDLPRFPGQRILLAEDVEINQEILLTLLEPTGIEIDCAANGKEAVEKFSSAPDTYGMVFMDVHMPEMDGYEATRRIRAIEAETARKQIPIVAMTANVFREDIEKCLAAGMNGHVGKPINIDEVLEKLRAYLGD